MEKFINTVCYIHLTTNNLRGKYMKNLRNILKAAVVIGIALAFIMPGAAFFTDNQTTEIKEQIKYPIKNKLSLGRGWVEQASNFWEPYRGINHVHIVDENIVWAVGYDGSGGLLPVQEFTRTTDGGETWEADVITSAPEEGDSAMIFALDENTAWIPIHTGDPQGIWKTSDGGDTWVRQDTANFSGDGAFPNIVYFWDENNGWCQGDAVDGYFEMYTTSDGGENWVRVPEENIPPPAASNEYGTVGYYDVVGDTVWWGTQCTTLPGRVFKSTDRGLHWTVADTPFPSYGWVDVRMKDETNGLAMDKREGGSLLAETSDGGETWTLIEPSGPFYSNDISYIPGTDNMWISTGAAILASGASYSTDGGHSWIDYPEVQGTQLLDCDFIEGPIGWAGSFNVDDETGGIYKYTKDVGKADLLCEGTLYWDEIKPGATVEGEFIVKNFGDTETQLDWEITDMPSWGEWTFDPESGIDLTPEDGDVTVKVTCVVPDVKDQEFNGRVKVENLEDSNDYCDLAVTIITPKNKHAFVFQFLQSIIQQFPILEKVISVSILLGKLLIL